MMAKDQLQQDMLLVGPPGAGECFRRRLALAYAELTQKPMEILTISGDLTESDLKQRRELVQNHQGSTTVEFVDQAPVRAAKHGRLLLLDGIEKAERNVLPTLNNLLENREMYLEDGTLLLPPHRVDDLSQSATSSSWIPVHPDFRVIALGVPSPPFPGRSLDPPIRSRFQIRRVDNPSSEQLYEQLVVDNDVSTEQQTLAKACAVLASVMQDNRQFFPFNNLSSVFQTLARFPQEDERSVIRRAYPLATKKELNELVQYFDKNQSNKQKRIDVSRYTIQSLEALDGTEYPQARVTFDLTNGHDLVQKPSVVVPSGRKVVNSVSSPNIVYTIGFRKALAAMVQEHASGKDILLLSPKGEGKNALANEFASMLGYKTHLFAIYSEMTSQDLLLRRGTDASTGETIWEESPLLRAARNGDVCILDGIEKLRPDVLASLQR
jgi:MoxR-like ATPase